MLSGKNIKGSCLVHIRNSRKYPDRGTKPEAMCSVREWLKEGRDAPAPELVQDCGKRGRRAVTWQSHRGHLSCPLSPTHISTKCQDTKVKMTHSLPCSCSPTHGEMAQGWPIRTPLHRALVPGTIGSTVYINSFIPPESHGACVAIMPLLRCRN